MLMLKAAWLCLRETGWTKTGSSEFSFPLGKLRETCQHLHMEICGSTDSLIYHPVKIYTHRPAPTAADNSKTSFVIMTTPIVTRESLSKISGFVSNITMSDISLLILSIEAISTIFLIY